MNKIKPIRRHCHMLFDNPIMGLLQCCSYMSLLVVFCSLLLNPSCSLNPETRSVSTAFQNEDEWKSATATWYGEANGAGSDSGACGYGDTVEYLPLNKMVTAMSPSLYENGKGCGACFQVKCTENAACSGNPVTVVTTDSGPPGLSGQDHFDLSGTAFGAMAKSGQADDLRHVGRLQVQYTRVACEFHVTIAFKVDNGSNPYYLAMAIEYENGDSDLAAVELKQALPSDPWLSMKQDWGAVWKQNSDSPFRAPLSVMLTEGGSRNGQTVVAENVIPVDWKPGNTYRSAVNFKSL